MAGRSPLQGDVREQKRVLQIPGQMRASERKAGKKRTRSSFTPQLKATLVRKTMNCPFNGLRPQMRSGKTLK